MFVSAPDVTIDPTTLADAAGVNLAAVSAAGALKVDGSAVNQPVINAASASVTATWTSATALNTALTANATGYGTVEFSVILAGSVISGTLMFESSDDGGTTWFPFVATKTSQLPNDINQTYAMGGNISQAFQGNISGFTQFRIRLSPAITGTGSAVVRINLLAVPSNLYVVATQNNANALRVQLSDGSNHNLLTAPGAIKTDESTAASSLIVTATAATGVAVTATLPASASNFHYIDMIEITKYFTVANAASATPLVVTTTNLPGSLALTFGQPLGTIGTTDERIYVPPHTIKSSVLNTATTIVCPATVGIIWRINVFYRVAP
jgi:hypothetical protein